MEQFFNDRKVKVDALNVVTIPTITGSATSNLPYIFLVDLHYQSIQTATKGRKFIQAERMSDIELPVTGDVWNNGGVLTIV